MIAALRGMKDIIEDAPKFLLILAACERAAKRAGFAFIETPHLEETALFRRSVGESSDIVGKEMYEFTDKSGDSVCLRPEGTAGAARAFVEKKFDRAGEKRKFYYDGAMFRHERPQKGRLRSFHQFGVESFGEKSVYEDANLILLAARIFDDLGIKHELKINSLGCEKCMADYREKLVKFLGGASGEICDDCLRRKDVNPIRALDCKNESCQKIYENAPLITDNLCEECDLDFAKLREILIANNMKFIIDKKLVRGLDYYNKTAFEFVSSEIGSQSAIAGGGRYDKLIETLGGKATFAVGFAIGIERIYDLVKTPEVDRDGIYIGALDSLAVSDIFAIANKLLDRQKVMIEYEPKKLATHLKNADKLNAKICAIIGEEERVKNEIWIKDLAEKTEYKKSVKEWLENVN
ncbi:MAG: histidine--tRNA ligase [Helicobacteraceae bacterium]|jgi:histidyl-tRNA synthetase|nr:histidine--tRNA ligase [Helicobacteraceae bacterium]